MKDPAPNSSRFFSLTDSSIDTQSLKQQIASDSAGAHCIFEGIVRNHNEGLAVSGLRYSAYESMAIKEGQAIINNAFKAFEIEKAVCIHRIGTLIVGDTAVWVGVSAAHRDPAFRACRFIIDTIKREVPIWKREDYLHTTSAWVKPN